MLYTGSMKKDTVKIAKQFERHFKGVANHWRISILLLAYKQPGMTLENLSEQLNCNMKTLSEHTRRLVQAGLLNKNYVGRTVKHVVSPYGKSFCEFIHAW